jgi:hypothetical protein
MINAAAYWASCNLLSCASTIWATLLLLSYATPSQLLCTLLSYTTTYLSSAVDPDPYVFGSPGSRYLIIERTRIHQSSSKNSTKNLDFYCFFLLLYVFLSLKKEVNVPSKSNPQKNIGEKLFFVCILKVTDEKSRIRSRTCQSVVRIHTKMSRIHNTASELCKTLLSRNQWFWCQDVWHEILLFIQLSTNLHLILTFEK